MRLVAVSQENREHYQHFENAKDLSLYMSRIYPDTKFPYLKWMYIEENQHYVGSVWLEGKNTHWVKLGIFLAEPAYRDKGIGKQAMVAMCQKTGSIIIEKLRDIAGEQGCFGFILSHRSPPVRFC